MIRFFGGQARSADHVLAEPGDCRGSRGLGWESTDFQRGVVIRPEPMRSSPGLKGSFVFAYLSRPFALSQQGCAQIVRMRSSLCRERSPTAWKTSIGTRCSVIRRQDYQVIVILLVWKVLKRRRSD
jgi:hypothetical protein